MKYIEESTRFVALDDNQAEIGELSWSNAGESLIIIDHTYVDDKHRGQGIAEKLVSLSAEYARKNGKKVMPLCPFAKKEFNQKKEYQDLLH